MRLPVSHLRSLLQPLRIRSGAVLLVTLAGAAFFSWWLDRHYLLRDWLVFDLLIIWGWDAVLTLACASFGYAVVSRWAAARDRPPLETLALGLPVGLVGFVLGMYAGGFLGIYGRLFAVALPVLMGAIGLPSSLRSWRAGRTGGAAPPGLHGLPLAATVFGSIALAVLYLGVMSPDAVNYDASWNHLVVAQDYARAGRIVSFPGDWIKSVPHLGSVVNTWSFLVPGLTLPALRWTMALHTELTIFLWTLVGVAAGSQWLLKQEPRGTWAAFFLFPSIFVYDNNMGGAADHFAALFAVPLALATTRVVAQRFATGPSVVWGVLAGGALLTKIQVVYFAAPLVALALASGAFAAWQSWRKDRLLSPLADLARGLAIMGAVALAVFAPHAAKNLVFYRNPLYPLMQDLFTASTPAVPDAAFQFRYLFADWRWHAPPAIGEKLSQGIWLVFTHSFVPHYSFLRNLPTLGSLFTLSLPILPFLKDARRLWAGAFVGCAGLFLWACTYQVDRNLQIFLPILVAVTAATLVRAWQLAAAARVGVALLIAVQLAWSGDLYFSGSDRINGALALIRSGLDGRARDRFSHYRRQYLELGRSLPSDAIVMLHNAHGMLGIDRPVLLDWIGFQGAIDYRQFRRPQDLHRRLRELGVTHVVHVPGGRAAASKQEEIVFGLLAAAHGPVARSFAELRTFPLSPTPPPGAPRYDVLVAGIAGYADGLYPVEALSTCEELPPALQRYPGPQASAPQPFSLLDRADVALIGAGASVPPEAMAELQHAFQPVVSYSSFRVLARPTR